MPSGRRHTDLNSAALRRARVHPDLTGLTGAGAIICVIDYGFDVLHPALRTRSGETRFAALIDHNGRRLMRSDINRLIRTCEEKGNRRTLDEIYDAHANYFGRGGVQVGAHGSWVASIAAGSRTADFCGAAPEAALIGVQLDLPDSAWREEDGDGRPTWLETASDSPAHLQRWDGWRSYEDSNAIISALNAGYELARCLKPDGIVINLSIGAWAGGHDPQSPVNQAIDAIIEYGQRAGEPTAVVVTGTGNAGADCGHATGTLTRSIPVDFLWSVNAGNRQQSKLEIWSDCSGDLDIEVRSKSQACEVLFKLEASAYGTRAITTLHGQVIGIAENRGVVRDGLRSARILLHPALITYDTTASRDWQFEISVRSENADGQGDVHAWIERDCSGAPLAQVCPMHRPSVGHTGASNALRQLDRDMSWPSSTSSLTSIACAASVIAVAGLDNQAADDAVIPMSGRGPQPWQTKTNAVATMPSPLIAAPANGLFGARSKTTGYMRGSGTSAAAALVSGAAALAIEAAGMAGRKLDHLQLADALTGTTDILMDGKGWQPDRGFGALRFDASAILGSSESKSDEAAGPTSPAVSLRKAEMSDERTLSPPV